MLMVVTGAYSFKLKDGTEKIKISYAEDIKDPNAIKFGIPSNSISFKKERFCSSSGVPVEFNEKLIGKKFLVDFGIFEDRESGKSISYPKSFDEVK